MHKEFYSDQDIPVFIEGQIIHTLNFISAPQRETIPLHSHGSGCYEIHYVAQGRGRAVFSGQACELAAGTLYITGPYVEHAQVYSVQDPVWEYCLYLKLDKGKTFSQLAGLFEQTTFWSGRRQFWAEDILKALFRELERKDTGYKIQAEAYMKLLLISLIRKYKQNHPDKRASTPPSISSRASLIIEESFLYGYQTLTLETLSERLGLSQRQTERLLLGHYGKNFQQKKKEERMAASVIFLTDTTKSITEISHLLGYSTMEHFSAAFRTWYGISPLQYRKQKINPSQDTV